MKIKRFLKVLIVFVILILITNSVVMAVDDRYINPNQFDNYHSSGNTAPDKVINKGIGIALSLIRNVALGWAIIMLIVIAIKYMVATPDAKGQLKKDVPTYCIGAIMLFGAAGIMQLITYFVSDTVGV